MTPWKTLDLYRPRRPDCFSPALAVGLFCGPITGEQGSFMPWQPEKTLLGLPSASAHGSQYGWGLVAHSASVQGCKSSLVVSQRMAIVSERPHSGQFSGSTGGSS